MGVSKNSCHPFKINPDVALNRNLYKMFTAQFYGIPDDLILPVSVGQYPMRRTKRMRRNVLRKSLWSERGSNAGRSTT